MSVAPTLVASRTALPPKGAELRLGRPGASFVAPTLVASRTALPPEGVVPPKGGLSAGLAPTLAATRASLPPEGAGLAWGGPARRPFFGEIK